MKKLISLLIAVCIVLGSVLCGALAEEEENMTYETDHFSFLLPGQWLTVAPEDDPGLVYFYKKEVQSTEDGYMMVRHINDIITEAEVSQIPDFYEGIAEGLKSSSSDQQVYTEDITIDSYQGMFFRYNLEKNGVTRSVPGIVVIANRQLLMMMYLNDSVSDAGAELIFLGIVDSVKYHD